MAASARGGRELFGGAGGVALAQLLLDAAALSLGHDGPGPAPLGVELPGVEDRKSTRLSSSHTVISYAVFCLKKKNDALRGYRFDLRLDPHVQLVSAAHPCRMPRFI